jgi:hypothetical protein
LGNYWREYQISAKASLGYYELKKDIPWFDEGYTELLDQWKQARLQWSQDSDKINGDDLNNVRCLAGRHFGNKKREYLEDKINELARNSKNKNISDLYREVSRCKKGYQRRGNIMKDENGDLLADSQKNLNRRKNYFSQLLLV